jgi:hypothetical protein
LEDLAGIAFRIRKKGNKDPLDPSQIEENGELLSLMDEVGVIDQVKRNRLVELIRATRELAGIHLLYNWKFSLSPDAITWKEFRELLALWKKSPNPGSLTNWIEKHAIQLSLSRVDIESNVFEAMINAKENAASEAANAKLLEANAEHCTEAGRVLEMTCQFLGLPGMLNAERFKQFYGKSTYWIAFTKNDADRILREKEKTCVLALAQNASDSLAESLITALEPWDPWKFMAENAIASEARKKLLEEVISVLLPKAQAGFLSSLHSPEAVRRLQLPKEAICYTHLLFDQAYASLRPSLRDGLLAWFQDMEHNPNAIEQANDFLQLLVDALRNNSVTVAREGALTWISDAAFIASLWKVATEKRIQFRMLHLFLSNRKTLIDDGVDESLLPLTEELAVALPDFQKIPIKREIESRLDQK